MSYNYPLKYRTLDQVVESVAVDFYKYEMEGMINPQELIKVIKRVNYDLGLRIMMTKEALLDIEKGRVKLPDDFYTLNYALICDETLMVSSLPQGTHIEELLITPYQDAPPAVDICAAPQIDCRTTTSGCGCNSCNSGCTCDGSCGCGGETCLCPQCQPENTLCNTTNNESVIVTTTVVTPPVIATIHACNWTVNTEELSASTSLTITINNIIYSCEDSHDYLNCLIGLNLGEIIITRVDDITVLTIVGDNTYGNLVINGMILGHTIAPYCVDIITELADTSACIWPFTSKTWDETSQFSLEVDGNLITLFAPINLTYLNSLNLGVFDIVTDGTITILTVHGNHVYGPLYYDSRIPGTHVDPICTPVSNTPGGTTTTTTTTNSSSKDCYSNPPTCKPRVILNCKGEEYELVQIVNPTVTNYYKRLLPIKILQNAEAIECGCPNLYISSQNTAWIKNGFLYTNFDCGKVYINYQGTLVDDDDNLMVPDHDGMNDYYEYAVKQRILENLMMNDEPVMPKLQLIEARLRTARIYALNVVNTPNFAEMKELWWANRRAQYAKYYDMFKSYQWYQWDRNPNLDMMQNPGT